MERNNSKLLWSLKKQFLKAENDDKDVRKAFVVKQHYSLNQDDVIKFFEKRGVYYKRLREGVEFIDKIPASVAGKVTRKQLQPTELKTINCLKLNG